MSIHVRNKGHNGEREICHLLQDHFNKKTSKGKKGKFHNRIVNRNVDQVRDGGADIIDVRPFAIEVKRQERLLLKQWWEQALSQMTKKNPVPVLVYRKNRQKWKVIIPARLLLKKRYYRELPDIDSLGYTLEISWDLFLVLLDKEVANLKG